MVVAFIEYLAKFFAPIRDLSTKYTVMQQAMAAAERVFTLLDTKEPDAPPLSRCGEGRGEAVRPRPAPRGEGRGEGPLIDLRGVTFGYRPDQPVLSDVTLSIDDGETVAIVGSTGAGKSTLIKLLPRLYDAQAGEIRIDGIDIKSLDARAAAQADRRGQPGRVHVRGHAARATSASTTAPSTTSASWPPPAASAPIA